MVGCLKKERTMRLTFSGVNLSRPREVTKERLQWYKDIGFRCVGGGVSIDTSEDDIKYLVDLFGEMEMSIGECYFGGVQSIYDPDPNFLKASNDALIKAVRVGGKLGIDHIQCSIGSMHPGTESGSTWMHHPDNFTQKALDLLVENARKIAPYAEDNKCMVSPECTQWTIVYNPQRMKEYVERVDSLYMKVNLDFVNQMNNERVYQNAKFTRCAVALLGECIGSFHVKDVIVRDELLVSHIDETDIGTGVLDHEAIIRASTQLEPWKTFVIEHVRGRELIKPSHDHIQAVADRIGHTWTDPLCTRRRWEQGLCK